MTRSDELVQRTIIRPRALQQGETIGICTPSFPAHVHFREKYEHGLRVIAGLGFKVREGSLTRSASCQGYRSGTPQARAQELLELFQDPDVRAIIATIGGHNSASLIPYLDFDLIARNPKIFCGYSDTTSLHLAILAYAGLGTFYGPAVVPSFGEWPSVLPETRDSFLAAVSAEAPLRRELVAPARFSRQVRDARSDAWKTGEREFQPNMGPTVLYPGEVRAPCIVANLNTLVTAAGTSYFPDLRGRILVIEEMNAALSEEERDLRHLERLGVFEQIVGLVIGKPEVYAQEGAPFGYAELVAEIVPQRAGVPVVMDFDCGHTTPVHALAQEITVEVQAPVGQRARIFVCDSMVS